MYETPHGKNKICSIETAKFCDSNYWHPMFLKKIHRFLVFISTFGSSNSIATHPSASCDKTRVSHLSPLDRHDTTIDSSIKAGNEKYFHVPHVDLLRAAAITCVFLSHLLSNAYQTRVFQYHGHLGYEDSLLQTYLRLLAGPGHLGVVMFFMISGFCIRLSTCREPVLNYGKFMWKRLWRIAPPYWFCLALLVFWGYNRPEQGYGLSNLILHTVFLHNVTDVTFHSINSPFWSIALEVQTYAMFPLLLLMISNLGKIKTGAILAGIALLSAAAARPTVQGLLHEDFILGIVGRSPLVLWFAWYLGLVLADDHLRDKTKSWNSWMLIIISLLIFPMITMIKFLAPLGVIFNALLVYIIGERFLRVPLPKILLTKAASLVGVASYSIYLWFDPILMIASQWAISQGLVGHRLVVAGILIVFPTVITLSYILFKFTETPAIKAGKLLYNKLFINGKKFNDG